MTGGRGRWLVVAKIALSLALVAFLLWRIHPQQVAAVLRQAEGRWLLIAAAVMLGSNVLGSWQWHRLLQAVEIRLPFWKVCAYYHIGLFFNNFLPMNIGGDLARIADTARHGAGKATALSAVLLDRLIGTAALATLALATTLPLVDRFHLALAYLALVVFFVVAAGLVWAAFHPGMVPVLARLLRRVGLGALAPHLDELAARLAAYRGQPRLLARLFLVALITQVSRIAVHALVARALGLAVPLQYFLLFVPLLAVIVSLPISLNGIGVREGAGVVLFGLVGVDRAHAFTLQFATYLVAVAVSLLGGLAALARLPRRRDREQTGRPGWT